MAAKQKTTALFATDFSEPADRAYTYAAALAKALNSRVVILNVLQVPMELDLEYPVNTLYLKELQKESAAELGRWVRRAEKDGLRIMVKQTLGEPGNCIEFRRRAHGPLPRERGRRAEDLGQIRTPSEAVPAA